MAEHARVLIIGYVWPEPRSSAAGAHMMQLIEQFRLQGWEVVFASPAQPGDKSADLAALGVSEKSISLNCSSFDHWVKELGPDIVLFDRFMMEEQFGWRVAEQCPDALRVLETSDLHCLRETRHQLLKQHTSTNTNTLPHLLPEELHASMAIQEITLRELAAIYRCDISLLLSDFEIDVLTRQFHVPASLLCHCPFLLDTPDTTQWPGFSDRKNFISIGNFLHAPNWDSVRWLEQLIWPLIRKKIPDADLFVYGAYTPQKARDLHKPAQGFHVAGWCDDAQQVMRQARICLAPLRFGAGIKGKLADAMWCGTPCVTTSIGAEAMQLDAYAHDNADAIASAAVELYNNRAKWEQAQQHGLAVIHDCFNKKLLGDRLLGQIEDCRNRLAQHRLNNFTGRILQHHQHRSTEYMARWIEAKNKNDAQKPGGL